LVFCFNFSVLTFQTVIISKNLFSFSSDISLRKACPFFDWECKGISRIFIYQIYFQKILIFFSQPPDFLRTILFCCLEDGKDRPISNAVKIILEKISSFFSKKMLKHCRSQACKGFCEIKKSGKYQ